MCSSAWSSIEMSMFTLTMSLKFDLGEISSFLRGASTDLLADAGLEIALLDRKEEPLDLTSSMNC